MTPHLPTATLHDAARSPRATAPLLGYVLAIALVAAIACGDGSDERRLDIEVREPPPADSTGEADGGTAVGGEAMDHVADADASGAEEDAGDPATEGVGASDE